MKNKFQFSNIFLIATFLFLFSNYSSYSQGDNVQSKLKEAVKYLASDELKGRFPGTDGIEKAAVFIEEDFKRSGLKVFNNSFRQEFSVTTAKEFTSSNTVDFETVIQRPGVPANRLPKVKQNWVIGEDYVPLAFSENKSISGEIAFVGFGISAPELKYDDYEGIDVKDKIVIFISDNPDAGKKDSPFDKYSSLQYKTKNAWDRGAIGMIMVKIQGDSMNVFEIPEYRNFGNKFGIVAIQAFRQSLSKFFPKDKALLALEKQIVANKKPASFVLPNISAAMKTDLQNKKSATYNIMAYVEGTDSKLKDEYLVVGAHYDHLGYGSSSSLYVGTGRPQIHNGADDNASGVATMLELASRISQNPLKRSVIFVAFSAEEMGLLGSSYFVNNPPIDVSNIVAMVNFDMVGRMEGTSLTVFGSTTGGYFNTMLDSLDLIDTVAITKASDAYGPSDHVSFILKDIPSIMFFTGLHEDYHKPSDDWNKINYKGMEYALNFSYSAIETIANSNERPTFHKPEGIKAHSTTEREHSYGKVWFGIVPDFEESPLGAKISGASAGSPADKAGMQAGDIIINIDGNTIKNLQDFMNVLKPHKVGDVLKVTVIRGEKQVELSVTLAARE